MVEKFVREKRFFGVIAPTVSKKVHEIYFLNSRGYPRIRA